MHSYLETFAENGNVSANVSNEIGKIFQFRVCRIS